MPNPNYDKTLTLYHNDGGTWIRTVLQNCFYKCSINRQIAGNNLAMIGSYIARIPAGSTVEADVDDLLILGDVTEEITNLSPNTATQILAKYKPNAFRVKVFSDNTSYPGGHYRLEGV